MKKRLNKNKAKQNNNSNNKAKDCNYDHVSKFLLQVSGFHYFI